MFDVPNLRSLWIILLIHWPIVDNIGILKGHRLGSALEITSFSPAAGANIPERVDEDIPAPLHDPNLSDDLRTKRREDRLAAAEARMSKQSSPPKKNKTDNNAPLRGPNSEPLMRWNAG